MRPIGVVASNMGQALWTGIVSRERAKKVAERLMQPDMYSGWGIRTLSEEERRYNPVGYHLGTVWPHDNSIIAAGFRRYGLDEAARQVMKGIFEAATYFSHYRLPELFSGFSRQDYEVPVAYPVACHPQAWAAGSVPFMVETLLGLVPDAFEKRLRIVRPTLPDFVHDLELRDLRVGRRPRRPAFRADGGDARRRRRAEDRGRSRGAGAAGDAGDKERARSGGSERLERVSEASLWQPGARVNKPAAVGSWSACLKPRYRQPGARVNKSRYQATTAHRSR